MEKETAYSISIYQQNKQDEKNQVNIALPRKSNKTLITDSKEIEMYEL